MLRLKDTGSGDILRILACLWSPLVQKNSPLIFHKLVIFKDYQISSFHNENTSLKFKGLFEMSLSEGTEELTVLTGR